MEYFIMFCMVYFSIFIHEYGHYITSTIFKLEVIDFGIGVGPKLFSTKYKGTNFQFRLIPFGGYVTSNLKNERRLGLIKRLIILLAGVLFNFIVAIFSMVIYSQKGLLVALKIITIGIYKMISMFFTVSSSYLLSQIYTPDLPLDDFADFTLSIMNGKYFWLAFFSINLFLVLLNLVPLPVLDGGRIITCVTETILFKRGVSIDKFDKFMRPIYIISWIIIFSPLIINPVLWTVKNNELSLIQKLLMIIVAILIPNIAGYVKKRFKTN